MVAQHPYTSLAIFVVYSPHIIIMRLCELYQFTYNFTNRSITVIWVSDKNIQNKYDKKRQTCEKRHREKNKIMLKTFERTLMPLKRRDLSIEVEWKECLQSEYKQKHLYVRISYCSIIF